MLAELIRKNRSCRRFCQDHPVNPDTLRDLVDLARCSASAANRQPLKYVLSTAPEANAAIFTCLGWAGYLKDWAGPAEGERPSAYIVICGDTRITTHFDCDHGIAAQSILLGAREAGLAGCMIGNIRRKKLQPLLNIDPALDILLVLAMGKPAEAARLIPVGTDGDIRYFRDEEGIHHVPKRSLDDIIVKAW
jgi:nitroreductase